ncbi:hypothetical protein [Spartinivicinus poritis]|uniref:Uncharacterized protein n=1 Tax=Spartinivicinus poritis TaxID=2994640 RepID=A0ABT5UKB6_9GAMM|nr:hypothetical protein [Spartinivicinus sp. A2-2]MDE1465838.1 hypothetical protein [Spartinivicinus sp. A2-2]
MPKNSLVTDEELTTFSAEERKAFISGTKSKKEPEPVKTVQQVKEVEPAATPAEPKNDFDPNEKPTEQFLLRLNRYEDQLLGDAFENCKHRSKQQLLKAILLPELKKLAKYK